MSKCCGTCFYSSQKSYDTYTHGSEFYESAVEYYECDLIHEHDLPLSYDFYCTAYSPSSVKHLPNSNEQQSEAAPVTVVAGTTKS